jgi:hypothetical protein
MPNVLALLHVRFSVGAAARTAFPIAALLLGATAHSQTPAGRIDAGTWVTTPHGTFGGVPYTRHEAMFDGVTSNQREFRVPCQIIAPTVGGQGSGLLLFDWLVASTIPTAVGQEQADARYTLTDAFLFGRGVAYATVRCDAAGIGRRSPVADPFRPWSDGLLDTASERIVSPGDEFDIVVAFVHALRTDPLAVQLLGPVGRRAAFGYSASGHRLRGLLRMQIGVGLFDFSLVGGSGDGYAHPTGNGVGFTSSERDPLAGAGLEIDFHSETDVLALGAHRTRRDGPAYRVYQFAGAAHLRDVDAAEFGLADASLANPADWVPFFRALFVAGDQWCDGIQPPPSLWLGAQGDARIARDANGNALVTHVGGQPVSTLGHRLPAVAVGENHYLALAPAYVDGSFLGQLRALAGGRVDRTGTFPSHAAYVAAVTQHALDLVASRHLLPADASAIVQAAASSGIGN